VLVGRESELSLLAERIERRRAIAVLGEAGVGKTALVRAAAERAGKLLYEAGALATLSWLPYLPLRRAFGREFEDGDAAYVASEVEREVGSALLFLDDLHWADAQTRALLPLLAGRIPLVGAIRRGDPATAAALEMTSSADLELMPLEPLAAIEAAQLARLLHPELSRAASERLVGRSGGNPFLLEQLAATGEPSESLSRAVASRLRLLTPGGREAIGLLALLGRPAAPELLGAAGAELVSAGLAIGNGEVSIRHALIAEATVEELEPEERRRLHSRLAAEVTDLGESARHHAAAGERAHAHENALLAAERASTPGERASHLALAAECATGPDAAWIRVEAASLLNGLGDYDGALALLDAVSLEDQLVRAESALLRGRAAIGLWQFDRARAELDEARCLAAGSGGEIEVRIQIEELRLDLELDAGDTTASLFARANAVLTLARERGFATASALRLVAQTQPSSAGSSATIEREAIAAARAEGDVALECEIADDLGLPSFPPRRSLMAEMAERAQALRLTAWERRFRCRLAGLDFHAGAFRAAYEASETLLTQRLEPWERYLVVYYAAQSASDLGLHPQASALLDELDRLAVAGHEQRRQALWARTDIELLAGRSNAALAAADEALALFPHRISTFILLARGWACLELGLDPGEAVLADRSRFLAGARPELQGVRLLADGCAEEASRLFSKASERWRGAHARGELRCLWAAGEALRRTGKKAAAVESLLAAEERAAAHEHLPLLRWIHRSLRLAGERRAAPRSRDGALTRREREVLDLVGEGLANDEIAGRLGLGRPTVVRLIRTASLKLGAKNRAQAAVLARR
jgi:DNA-binding CsgD family transcriptional regulator